MPLDETQADRTFNGNGAPRLCCWLLLITLTVASFGCLPAGNGSNVRTLVVTGSSTVAPVLAEIARRYESQHPEIRINVQTGGSGKGIADVRAGIADIGMASRPLQSDESDLISHSIALDGVCLIVHAENPVIELSRDQVQQIYRGEVSDWNTFGGPETEIIVVHKAEGRATLEVFLEHFDLHNPQVQADVIVGDNEHAIKTVAQLPGAVGYVSIGTAAADVAAGASIRLLPLNGVPATVDAVASGEFSMKRPLNLITTPVVNKQVAEFLQYCQSEQVHDLVVAQQFVPTQP